MWLLLALLSIFIDITDICFLGLVRNWSACRFGFGFISGLSSPSLLANGV
jgi:hypothetical protein